MNLDDWLTVPRRRPGADDDADNDTDDYVEYWLRSPSLAFLRAGARDAQDGLTAVVMTTRPVDANTSCRVFTSA
jgi:hypothetical protein